MNFGDYTVYLSTARSLRTSSVRLIVSRTKLLLAYLRKHKLSEDQKSIEQYVYHLKQKGLKNNSVNSYILAINYLHDYCIHRKIKVSYSRFKILKKNTTHIDVLSQKEIELIANTRLDYGFFHGKDCNFLNDVYTSLIYFLACTGCRFSEAVNLTTTDLDLISETALFRETKNGEIRKAYLFEPCLSYLKAISCYQENGLVFTNSQGKHIHAQDFSLDLRKRAKKAGVTKKVHPHLFRHSFVTEMLKQGVPLVIIAELVGHKDIKTTQKYTHLVDTQLRDAMLNYPMVKKCTHPSNILKRILEEVKKYTNDERLNFSFCEEKNSINIKISY